MTRQAVSQTRPTVQLLPDKEAMHQMPPISNHKTARRKRKRPLLREAVREQNIMRANHHLDSKWRKRLDPERMLSL